eukprot:SAG31_NODE_2671_length_5270_cov_5.903114_6_plen_200_part_00
MVKRDRNHASVVVYSACNEGSCYVTGIANRTGRLLMEATKRHDKTRPFSANQNAIVPQDGVTALNDTIKYLSRFLDVEGFSHSRIAVSGALDIHRSNPTKAIVSSECCSCETQRGEDYCGTQTAIGDQRCRPGAGFPSKINDGVQYPHSLSAAQCLVLCNAYVIGQGSSTGGGVGNYSAGALGVWTLFDCKYTSNLFCQ